MSATRLAARIAVREARRRPFRSLLVIALVAIPVAGMTVSTTLIRTDGRTALEAWDAEYGSADLVLSTGGVAPGHDGPPPHQASDAVPAGAETVTVTTAYGGVRDESRRAFVELVGTDLVHPIHAGRYRVTEGRQAAGAGEVAVSPHLAERFDLVVGEPFVLVRPSLTLEVVGVVEDRECVRCDVFYGGTDGLPAIPAAATAFTAKRLLADLPVTPTADQLRTLLDDSSGQELGVEVRPVPGIEADGNGADAAIRWSIVVGALALAVVGIVIAAAFAVGARRQLVLLGQLSSNGATEQLLRRILVLQGTVTGGFGSVAGITAGLVGLHIGIGQTERYLDRRLDGYALDLDSLAVIGLVGIVGATLAALVPATSAARIPTLHALAGRRPLTRVRGALTAKGLLAMLSGLGLLAVATVGARAGGNGNLWAAVAIVGGLGVLFGATALTPAMVQRIEPLAGRTRGSLRIAARSLARNRTRTGAVIAAVAAAGALAVGGTTAARAVTIDDDYTRLAPSTVVATTYSYRHQGAEQPTGPIPADIEAQVARSLPDATLHRAPFVQRPYRIEHPDSTGDFDRSGERALVVDDSLAAGMRLAGDARNALRDEGIVVVDFHRGPARLLSVTFDGRSPMDVDVRYSRYSLGGIAEGVYVSPAFADALGLDRSPGPLVAINPDALSETELFDVQEIVGDQIFARDGFAPPGSAAPAISDQATTDPTSTVEVQFGRPDTGLDQRGLELLLAAVSVLFALVVVGIGLALASADEKDEREILTVAGAGPSSLSRVACAKAWVLATLGFALAVPVGFLPAATVVEASQATRALYFPAPVVAVLLIGAPAVAASAAYTVSSITRRVRPVRVSTATFD